VIPNVRRIAAPWAHRITLVFAGLLVGGAIPAARGDEPAPIELTKNPTYFYDAQGRRAFTPSTDEWVVAIAPAQITRGTDGKVERPAFIGPAVTPDRLPACARRMERQIEQRGVFVARGLDPSAVASRAEVRYALPVIYWPESNVPFYPTNQVLVRLNRAGDEPQLRDLALRLGCSVTPLPRGENRYRLTVNDTRAVHPIAVANYLHELEGLTDYAQPNLFAPKITHAPTPIDDPLYLSLQWHLDGDVAKGADPNSDINVESAWNTDFGTNAEGSRSVHVAVIDECVEMMHPDLFPNWQAGIDVDDGPPYTDFDPSPDGGQRHGTACAGLAVAKANNIGVRGVSPNSGLIGIKFFGGDNADTAYAFLFAMDPDNNGDHSDGAAILSNSWSYGSGTFLPPDVANAINTVALQGRNGKGTLVFFASGNDDHTVNGVSALAQMATTYAIGGTNSHAKHTEFSDVGPEVGVTAPTNDRGDDGVRFPWLDITTVDNTGAGGYNGLPDLDYTNGFGGTSAATPIAAGAAALVLSHDETMTADQLMAILQHTAVRLDEPYGRFDGITGHSHRFGYGRVDMGAAVAAVTAGQRWPAPAKNLNISAQVNANLLTWSVPTLDYATSLLVRSEKPFAWMPTDGVSYNVNDEVAPGVFVIHSGPANTHTDAGSISGAYFYGVYPRSSTGLYGFGARAHLIRDGIVLFSDNLEGPDPGWTTGGVGNEWQRGVPSSALSSFSQAVNGSGPLAGTRGVRAIGGDRCWGTDLFSTYAPDADAYLETPLVNLTGVAAPVMLEYFDWCLMETFYDTCSVEVVDAGGGFLGYLDPDTGGDYDWTQRVYDLTPFAGQPVKVRFRIQSDELLQRDGWFIDDVKITVAANIPLPPGASDVYVETPENTQAAVGFVANDPNPGTQFDYFVTALPLHGDLFDPFGGQITSVPYELLGAGSTVNYVPDLDYQGPDAFTYEVSDGGLTSNTATVSLSVGTPVVAYDYPLTTDPNWLTEGEWAYGVPLGNDGDPNAGFTGPNVYGYNLAGDYDEDLPAQHLTMLPFNCTGLSRVTIEFARWLGVEAGSFDNASLEASNDGVNWVTIWRHTGGDLQETSWSAQSYNIATVADGQPFVQVRWAMGPTDGNSEFFGWNLDDIRITAIGTPPANQPPLAEPVKGNTAIVTAIDVTLAGSDEDSPSIDYIITELPPDGSLSDPNGGVIAAVPYTLLAGGDVVTYLPDPGFSGFDTFKYQVTDGTLTSNVSTATVHVLSPAPFPYTQDFETGALDVHWFSESTGAGQINVTGAFEPIGNFHVTLDSGSTTLSLNELTLAIDLDGASGVLLYYDWKDFNEETNALPPSWTGSLEGDGVAISEDGETWHLIADFTDPARAEFYQTVLIDLDAAAAAAGIGYNKTFRLRFQQYDNNSIDVDGIALDNIRVLQGTGEPAITMSSLPPATLAESYGPVQVTTLGGDLPLIWSMPIEFTETDLGTADFMTNGVAQGWQGDDLVFDYTLPFAFPFYGVNHTDIKIATDGWINFGSHVGSTWNNSTVLLQFNTRIAPLWDSLIVDALGDIYIDSTTPEQCTIRWDAVTKSGSDPVAFAATLFADGRIRFDYGPGNSPISPTVGVSAGDGDGARYFLAAYDGFASLDQANSVLLDFGKLPPGLNMDTNGIISGTPSKLGDYLPVVKIVDQRDRTDMRTLPITVLTNVFGDFDQDGDADLDDLTWLVTCLEQTTPSGTCIAVFDTNGNEIVDLADFARFQVSFTGP
jgi:hypothetical protein